MHSLQHEGFIARMSEVNLSVCDLLDRAYRRHWDEICRYVRRSFGSGPPEPEDVAQAAFAQFAALDEPTRVDNLRAYLFRTAHNIAVDARRRNAHGAALMNDGAVIAPDEPLDFSPEEVLVSRDDLERVDHALRKLRPHERTAFLMHRVDGLSFAEIARRLGISASGARNMVDRGFEVCVEALERRGA